MRVGMLTRRSCMGIRGWLRLASASPGNLRGKDRMFICLHTATTPVYKNRFQIAPEVVVLHRLPLMPT